MASSQKDNALWGFPATGLNVSSFANDCIEQQAEKAYRLKLAKGIPDGAPVCQMHRDILDEQSEATRDGKPSAPELSLVDDPLLRSGQSTVPTASQMRSKILTKQSDPYKDGTPPAPELSLVGVPLLNPDHTTIPTTTALLPQCTLCFHHQNNLPPNSVIPEAFDACLCATAILTARCVYCALSTLEQKLATAIAERIRLDVDGNEFLACECGSHVMLPGDVGELVRKCVGCEGVVTAPFRDWRGDEVVFLKKSSVPALVIPASGENGGGKMIEPDSLLVAEPRAVPPKATVEVPDYRLRVVRPPENTSTIAPQNIERPKVQAPSSSHCTALPVCDGETNNHETLTAPIEPDLPERDHRRVDSATDKDALPLKDITNQTMPARRFKAEIRNHS